MDHKLILDPVLIAFASNGRGNKLVAINSASLSITAMLTKNRISGLNSKLSSFENSRCGWYNIY